MAQTIQIKRSTATAVPASLAQGEVAYSHNNGSGKLYIGRPGDGTVDEIGGKFYVDKVNNLTTSDVTEATGSLYFTNERVDDRVNNLLTAGTGITLTYDDTANTLEIGGVAQYGDSDVRTFLESTTNSIDGKLDSLTLTGDLKGPAAFTIDPSGHGDNTGAVTIAGDLIVTGTTTTINSTAIELGDRLIRLNDQLDEQTAPTNLVAGLEIARGNTAYDSYILWREANDAGKKWVVNEGGPVDYALLHANNWGTAYTGAVDGGTF